MLAGQLAFSQQITALGGDPAAVNAAVARAPVTVTSIKPPHTYNTQQLVLGILAGILIYLSLMLNGQAVAQGVVEEKSSRVVELLLATVRPWQLMAGKVVGIGIVGLAPDGHHRRRRRRRRTAHRALTISASAATSTVVWLVVWYLLGFFAYALAFAAVAALVSRQEDVNGVVTPVLMFVIIGYVLGISILPANPGSGADRDAVADPDVRADADADAARDGRRTGVAARGPVAGMLIVIPAADLAVRADLPQRGGAQRCPGQAARRVAGRLIGSHRWPAADRSAVAVVVAGPPDSLDRSWCGDQAGT